MIFEIAHHMALVPLIFLAALAARGQRRDIAWWWIAAAFAVSWLADTAAHLVSPWLVGLVYPVSQAALVGAVLLERRDALAFLAMLVTVGIIAAYARDTISGPDVVLRTVAWGGVAGIAWQRRAIGRASTALLVAFGLGWLTWLCYATWPGWSTWLVYQTARAAGMALFCWACVKPGPSLRLAT